MIRACVYLSAIACLCLALSSCEYVRPTLNVPLKRWEPAGGYRLVNLALSDGDNSDSLFLVAAFSGGGVRASTLAYGVLRELARHEISWQGKQKRLVDELDVIFALSGGSFPAAYYALYGDRLFQDFEDRFLRKDWDTNFARVSSGLPAIGFGSGRPTLGVPIFWLNCWMRPCSTRRRIAT
jgi:NTE family protein